MLSVPRTFPSLHSSSSFLLLPQHTNTLYKPQSSPEPSISTKPLTFAFYRSKLTRWRPLIFVVSADWLLLNDSPHIHHLTSTVASAHGCSSMDRSQHYPRRPAATKVNTQYATPHPTCRAMTDHLHPLPRLRHCTHLETGPHTLERRAALALVKDKFNIERSIYGSQNQHHTSHRTSFSARLRYDKAQAQLSTFTLLVTPHSRSVDHCSRTPWTSTKMELLAVHATVYEEQARGAALVSPERSSNGQAQVTAQ